MKAFFAGMVTALVLEGAAAVAYAAYKLTKEVA